MNYQSYVYKSEPLYPESYDTYSNYRYYSAPEPDMVKKGVEVPDTYHVGPMRSPVSHKDQDRNWATSQSPQGYTIELADDAKASQVAQTLQKVPKTEHVGQVKYEKNGQSYYKGLYGSYNSYEAAQQSLNSLPEDVKANATIKNWGNVQGNINE